MSDAPQADLLFDNGPVFTADGAAAPADLAVAVAGGRIRAVGPAARDLAGPRTERIDLAGRLLVPGFQDAHVHAVFGGLELGRCDLSPLKSAAEYLAAVGDVRARPPAAPVDHRRRVVARVVPRRSAYCRRPRRRGRWTARSSCQTATTTAPGSTAGRWNWPGSPGTPRTRPTGASNATPAASRPGCCRRARSASSSRCCPPPRRSEFDAAFDRAQALLHSLGITGWQDAMVGGRIGGPDNFDVYGAPPSRDGSPRGCAAPCGGSVTAAPSR